MNVLQGGLDDFTPLSINPSSFIDKSFIAHPTQLLRCANRVGGKC